jgi:hypothetical protein
LADVQKAIKGHEGKVVVLYLWGQYSVPDCKWLVDVVQLQKRPSMQPVAFMTVCHAPADRGNPQRLEKGRLRVRNYLAKTKAHFENFLLDEDDTVWATELGFTSGPTFVVFDQRGRQVKTFSLIDGEYSLADVEAAVRTLVAKTAKTSAK